MSVTFAIASHDDIAECPVLVMVNPLTQRRAVTASLEPIVSDTIDHDSMRLTPGTRLGPYEIESLIGSGGMAEVYKARDRRLERTVAVKRVTTSDARRFESEARAIAALNHPHICQIYDVGPDYLVLEYLQGEPLRGPVRPEEAVRLAAQVAAALEAAHSRGILHRDLKPANVMVLPTGDAPTVKLLDFGVARLAATDPDATRSTTGQLLGTPAYMSPEQAQGKPLDVRSDVFSFGLVLYELLSGQRAFAGDSTAEVLTAILRDDPPPFDAPAALQLIVKRCLAKEPARRFQTISEVKHALDELPRAGVESQSSIAVLPLANLSAERENEYFGDGLAEEIINVLAQVDGLKVIARTSAFSFKGKNEDIRHIAQALGVTHVLEGSVRRSGDRIRVTTQLIAASDGTHLWSERYDRPMTDVFAMQDEIAQAITASLKGRLIATPRRYTPGFPAYDAFLKGRAHLQQFTPDDWYRAKQAFEEAIALDAQYADPHAALALGHLLSGMHDIRPMREAVPLVRAEVDRALALNPSDLRPRFLLGAVAAAHDYDWAAARSHFAAAMSVADVSPYARWIYAGLYLRASGRFEESAAEMGKAVEEDPLNPAWHAMWAGHFIDAEQFDQAIGRARKALELAPNDFLAQQLLGETYWASGRRHDALPALERAYELAPWNGVAVGWLAAVLSLDGQQVRADALIAELDRAHLSRWGHAVYHLLTSNVDAAADWYARMIEHRDAFALIYAKASLTAPLRAHPRWPDLAAAMKLPVSSTRSA